MTKHTAQTELKKYNPLRSELLQQDLKLKMVAYIGKETNESFTPKGNLIFINLLPSVTFSQQ